MLQRALVQGHVRAASPSSRTALVTVGSGSLRVASGDKLRLWSLQILTEFNVQNKRQDA